MSAKHSSVSAGLARRRQLLLVVLAGAVAAVGVLVLGWLGAGSVSAQGSATTFVPNVNITVPQFEVSGANFLSGTRFGITYSRVGSDVGCTEFAAERYEVSSGGVVSFVSGRSGVSLVDLPAGAAEDMSCEYVVALSQDSLGKVRLDSDGEQVDLTGDNDADGVAVDVRLEGVFKPAVKFTVPSAVGFVGTEFRVGFSPDGTTVGCSEIEHVYVVQGDQGTVTDDGTRVRTYNFPVLVDVPSGGTGRCSYRLTFPDYTEPVPGATVAEDREPLYLQSNATATVSNSSATTRAVAVVYRADHGHSGTATSFNPDVIATVPGPAEESADNEFSGARIWLSYSSDTTGCRKKVLEKYSVNSAGAVTVLGDEVRLDTRPGGATTGDLCEYVVDFAKSSNDLLGLGSDIVRPQITEATTNQEEIAIVVVFSPALSFTVPLPDLDGDGEPNYEGTQFTVSYRPARGEIRGCSRYIMERYAVESDGTVVVLNPDNRVKLTKFPAGRVTGRFCQYTTMFNFQHRDGFSSPPNSLYTIWARSLSMVTFRYRSPEMSFTNKFKFNLPIEIPNVDEDSNGINDNSGAILRFTLTPILDSNPRCKRFIYAYYWVKSDGTAVVTGHDDISGHVTRLWLYDSPQNSNIMCEYRARFDRNSTAGSTDGPGLFLLDNNTFTFTGIPNKTLRYGSLLHVDINFSLPQMLTNEDQVSNIVGNTFDVTYMKASDAPSDCRSNAAETLMVDGDGITGRVGYSAKIIDRIPGESERCSYTLTFPEETGDLRFKSVSLSSSSAEAATGRTVTVSHADRVVNVSYDKVFDPSVGVSFSSVDQDYDSVRSFSVEYRRTSSLRSGCTEMAADSYELAADGTLTPVVEAKLVDIPAGETAACSYDITWPTIQDMSRQGNPLSNVNRSSGEITASYTSAFIPRVSILLFDASIPVGTILTVTYRALNSGNGCTVLASENFRVETGGRVSEPNDRTSLVGDIGGVGGECSYNVVWPEISGLRRLSSATVKVSAKVISAKYYSVFSPDVSFLLPAGVSVASGTVLAVGYARGAGADSGCSPSASEDYVVGADGMVGAEPRVSAVLVGAVGGVSGECSYDVTWPDISGLSRPPEGTVKVSMNVISAVYYTVFKPNIRIFVPVANGDDSNSIFSDDEFTVGYTSSDDRCFPSEDTFRVKPGGSVRRKMGEPVASLVNRIGGVDTACSYTVEFQPQSGDLVLQPTDADRIVRAGMTVEARYSTMFPPGVTVHLPSGADSHSGETFGVSYGQSNPVTGCSSGEKETYIIGSDGSVRLEMQSSQASLVDRPAGSSDRCLYEANFDPVIADHNYGYSKTNASKLVSASRPVSAVYRNMSYIYPVITLNVADIDNNNDDTHDFSGTSIEVKFVNALSGNKFCTNEFIETFTIQDSGNGTMTSYNVDLAAGQPGSDDTCIYSVDYEVKYSNDGQASMDRLIEQSGSTSSVSAGSTAVKAVFSSGFVPGVAISIPRLNDDTTGHNSFLGTVFDVIFKRQNGENGASALCSDSIFVSYTVDESGSVSTSNEAFELLGYTWEGDEQGKNYAKGSDCSYTVTFGSAVGDLNLQTTGPFTVGENNKSIAVSYATLFDATVLVGFPLLPAGSDNNDIYEDLSVPVFVTPLSSSCSDTNVLVFDIQNDGSVERVMNNLSLISWAGGASSSCSYSVTALPSFKDGRLVIQANSPGNITNEMDTRIVVYKNFFSPTLTFSITGLSEGTQTDFTGATLSVNYTARDISHTECARQASLTYIVVSNNVFTAFGDTPKLFDSIPAHNEEGVQIASERCVYEAAFNFISFGSTQNRLEYNGSTITVSGASPSSPVSLSVVSG